MDDMDDYGQIAFHAYKDALKWNNGPLWSELSKEMQDAWDEAANDAITTHVSRNE